MELQPRRRRSEALARWADPGWWGGSAGWGWGLLVDLPFEGLHSMSRGWGLGAQAGMWTLQE